MSVPVADRLLWNMSEASDIAGGFATNYISALEAKGEFPPRVRLPAMRNEGEGRKRMFVAAEVRAWANGEDWKAMVTARNGWGARIGA